MDAVKTAKLKNKTKSRTAETMGQSRRCPEPGFWFSCYM